MKSISTTDNLVGVPSHHWSVRVLPVNPKIENLYHTASLVMRRCSNSLGDSLISRDLIESLPGRVVLAADEGRWYVWSHVVETLAKIVLRIAEMPEIQAKAIEAEIKDRVSSDFADNLTAARQDEAISHLKSVWSAYSPQDAREFCANLSSAREIPAFPAFRRSDIEAL